MSNILIAYFSTKGNTKALAEKIADITGGELFEIVPKFKYSKVDLNWINKNSRSSIEMKDPASRVEIESKLDDVGCYDTIFIGFPIWWYVAPHIINSFLEQYDFKGKKIHLFATSGTSGIGDSQAELIPSAPDAVWGKAERFPVHVSMDKLEKWVSECLEV